MMTIDPEYYSAIPREPDEAGLIPVRQTLARLLGRPVPSDTGLYAALVDQYHIHGLYADVNGMRVDEGGAEIHLAVVVSHTKGV
jgi:hypothetical protein